MRGEQATLDTGEQTGIGSSPHARGAGGPARRSRSSTRIIPACAGSSGPGDYVVRLIPDHPRMRGEQRQAERGLLEGGGSSPHARGAGTRVDHLELQRGIIPACAGSRPLRADAVDREGDHPRMRGEQARSFFPLPSEPGSSPHARGAVGLAVESPAPPGIIPACAGSSSGGARIPRSGRDHPRMRGEQPLVRVDPLGR